VFQSETGLKQGIFGGILLDEGKSLKTSVNLLRSDAGTVLAIML
jgi:hypothetical protein